MPSATYEQRRPREVRVLVDPPRHPGVGGGGVLDDADTHAAAS
jgi:hypothetical protein